MRLKRMPHKLACWLAVGLVLLLAACSGDPGTGPKDVRWDRDACERCRMVLSDRNFSAQIRYFPEEKPRSRVVAFDDIGCAILWLEEQPWKDDPRTEIWVTDHRNGEWIDARVATYVKGKITPMEFGLGAQPEPLEGGLDFEQAKQHILKVEERFNIHGVHLLERFKQQAAQRDAARKAQRAESTLPTIIPEQKP
jgi:nitrous oxide reductase accessory protein NosL